MLSEEKNLLHVYQQWSIPEALIHFQYIEQSLKEVILNSHEIIKIKTKDTFNYVYSEKSGRAQKPSATFSGDNVAWEKTTIN